MVSSPIFTSTIRAWCGIARFEMGGQETSLTERLLRRDRWIVLGGLAAIRLLSWTYVLMGVGTGMSARSMTKAWLFPHRRAGHLSIRPDGPQHIGSSCCSCGG